MRHGLYSAAGFAVIGCISAFAWSVSGPGRISTARAAESSKPAAIAAQRPDRSLDQVLAAENAGRKLTVAPLVDDLAFLRRVSVDLIGRIPTDDEIQAYLDVPAAERRAATVDSLLKHDRFADRWTVFYADMLRLRSQADGGAALTAFVHQAIAEGMPFDVMCRQLLSANGKAGKVPEVGFILGDQADPMALAAATAQVFMGIRISCAQCHDHPFDVWKRDQFYGLAAYFGKTRRVESYLTKAIYTTEADQSMVLWPPEGMAEEKDRKPMKPAFPFAMDPDGKEASHVTRLVALRTAQREAAERALKGDGESIDDLLADADDRAQASLGAEETDNVAAEAKKDARDLKVDQDVYRASQLRQELAALVTSPRNRSFSRNLVNRLWADLVGRGFVEPVDDFSDHNQPSHPQTLDYLADEFVASGFDLRSAIRLIVTSDAYQRGHLVGQDEVARTESEEAFVAAPVRRVLSESLFDSIVSAGHMFSVKYREGENIKTVRSIVQVAVSRDGVAGKLTGKGDKAMAAMARPVSGGYDLESAIEVDFEAVLMEQADAPEVEMMTAVSNEELEAQMMMKERSMKYVDQVVETTLDDNPQFTSAMRMASPAAPNHFLRIFGQPARDALGEHRDNSASMRQALMMINGRLTHEASRVGTFEPIYKLLVGKKADIDAAIRLAYREILTREPEADELAEARLVLNDAENPREGMADLRWALFNCHEFRFLP